MTAQLHPFLVQNTKRKRKTIDCRIIHTVTCNTVITWLLDVDYVILNKYYYHTAKFKVLYWSADAAAEQHNDNTPSAEELA
jgi:hypothetical protein